MSDAAYPRVGVRDRAAQASLVALAGTAAAQVTAAGFDISSNALEQVREEQYCTPSGQGVPPRHWGTADSVGSQWGSRSA